MDIVGDGHDLEYWFHQAEAAAGIIKLIVLTPIFPDALKRYQNPDAPEDERVLDVEASVATGVGVLLKGEELGMAGPMTALASITIVKGTVVLYAMAARALLMQQGHELIIRTATDHRCVISARRKDSEHWQEFTWDFDRARKLHLDGRPNWRTQPKAMLMARCSSEASRYVAPDALLGMPAIYEELADADTEAAAALAAAGPPPPAIEEGKPKTAKRERKPARAALPAAPPATKQDEPAAPEIPKIQTGQRNRLFGLLRTLGLGSQEARADALSLIGGQLEPPRELESTAELLAPEADMIINHLEHLVEIASSDQSSQGETGHAPKGETEPAGDSGAATDQPKSEGDDWPPDSAGAARNE